MKITNTMMNFANTTTTTICLVCMVIYVCRQASYDSFLGFDERNHACSSSVIPRFVLTQFRVIFQDTKHFCLFYKGISF